NHFSNSDLPLPLCSRPDLAAIASLPSALTQLRCRPRQRPARERLTLGKLRRRLAAPTPFLDTLCPDRFCTWFHPRQDEDNSRAREERGSRFGYPSSNRKVSIEPSALAGCDRSGSNLSCRSPAK